MTDYPPCVIDRRPVHDGGLLCAACWADLEHDLTELAESLLYDLGITLAGLGRNGGSPIGIVVRSASRGLGFDEHAGALARQLHNCLGGWVRVLAEDNALPIDMQDRTVQLAAWLYCHERHIRRHEAVGDLWQEIHDLVEQVRRIVDRRPDRQYLGVCSAPLTSGEHGTPFECDADLYAIEGDAYATCRSCGALHHVEQRRRVLLDAVDDQLGTAAEIARALAAYGDVELRVERLRQWYSRGKIAQYAPRVGERWPRYRVGDARDILDPNRTVKAG